MSLPEKQQPIVDEKTALDEKIKALRSYCGGPAYRKIDQADQHLLVRQLQSMAAYSEILGERVTRLEESEHASLKANTQPEAK
jgi:hypothetical protein